MDAASKAFDHSGFIDGDAISRMRIGFWHAQMFAHATIHLHAEEADLGAAVGLPFRQAMQVLQDRQGRK